MNEFWSNKPNPSQLTLEDLEKAIEAVENAPPDPCSLGHHVLPAKALREPGYYICGNCRAVIKTERR